MQLLTYFPPRMHTALKAYLYQPSLTEIRLRIHQAVQVVAGERYFLHFENETVTQEDCRYLFDAICQHSVYAWANQLKDGFLTLPGGCRVGMAGRGVVENNCIQRIESPTFFNFRVAREWVGCSDSVLSYLFDQDGTIYHTLILSPPGCGKTTLLRDLARNLSVKYLRNVCIVDERGEIAGCRSGIPNCQLGPCCDVLDGCPKAQGMLWALRVMSPEVLICDEIGTSQEMETVQAALQCGCSVIASAHAGNTEQFYRRFGGDKTQTKLFERYVILSKSSGVGTVESIEDDTGAILWKKEGLRCLG